MSSLLKTDVVIIGAGPVGLFAIFECGMLNLKCHIVDALDAVGGQCSALYPEKPIYDIPAYPRILASELITKLSEQIAPFEPVFHLNDQVTALQKEGQGWLVTTTGLKQIYCKAVIIAAGVGAFGPNRPPLQNIESFEKKSVFYYITNKEQFRNKKVVIAGGGDSAVDWALALHDIAGKVTLVHRRQKFRAAPDSVLKLNSLVDSGRIDLKIPYQLQALIGNEGVLKKIILRDLDSVDIEVEADILLPFYGLSMNLGPILEWELALEKNLIGVEPSTMQTNKEGIFAIGDIVTYPGKLKLILTGFSECGVAAHSIYKHIYPESELHFEYSTTKGIP